MRTALRTIALLPATISLHAQIPAATLHGVVKDDLSGSAVRNARIALMASTLADPLLTKTDSEGKFEFSAPSGKGQIAIDKSGFLPFGPLDVELEPGAPALAIVLTQKRSVRATLQFSDGEPVADARISIYTLKPRLGSAEPFTFADARLTDDRGIFQSDQLWAGRYVLSIDPPRDPSLRSWNRVYLPSVDLVSRAEADLGTVIVEEANGTEVDGRVTPSKILPAGSNFVAVLRTRSDTPTPFASVGVTADGAFRFEQVPPGSYELYVMASRPIEAAFGLQPLRADGNPVHGVSIAAPESLASLTGTVVRVTSMGPKPAARVRVRVSLDGADYTSLPAWKATDTNGAFTVFAPSSSPDGADRYRIALLDLPKEVYVAGVRQDDRFDAHEPFLVRSGGGPISIELRDDGAKLAGEVVPAPVPGKHRYVVLVPENRNDNQAWRTAFTDDRGLFTLQAIAPGTYTVHLFASESECDESLSGALAPPSPIALKASEEAWVTLRPRDH